MILLLLFLYGFMATMTWMILRKFVAPIMNPDVDYTWPMVIASFAWPATYIAAIGIRLTESLRKSA